MRRLVNWLASPAPIFYLLPPLIVLIAAGTVAQKYVGLYVAERTIFSSAIIWLFGYIPLPGGFTLMALLSLGLCFKFLFKSRWEKARFGINLAHFGVLVLLIGGLISSLLGEEGFASIPEGEQTSQLRDYHTRELMVIKDSNIIATLNPATLKAGVVLKDSAFPFALTVNEACRNCRISSRAQMSDDLRGAALSIELTPTELMKNDESNTGGLTFTISNLSADTNGRYILFEDGPPTQLGPYTLAYSKQLRALPFSVKLVDFVKTTYPGTDTAKAYHSDVVITDGAMSWPARIAMNAPLRYRGYTLYQSSFMQAQDGKEITVLAVSQDSGQYLPYAGTFIMALGLLLHLFLRKTQAGAV